MKFNLENIKKLQKKSKKKVYKKEKKREKQEIKNLIMELKAEIKRKVRNETDSSIVHFYNTYDQKIIKAVSKYFTDLGFTVERMEEGKYRIANVLIISWNFD